MWTSNVLWLTHVLLSCLKTFAIFTHGSHTNFFNGYANATYTLIVLTSYVATLALGSRPRQGLVRVWTKSEARESHFMLPGGWECRRVWGNEHSHSQVSSHFGSWSPGGLLSLQRAIAGVKTPLDWGVPYIIGKILKCRCLKWARMTHLDIWNTSCGQKKGRESNC
jgi:hypothetical protein